MSRSMAWENGVVLMWRQIHAKSWQSPLKKTFLVWGQSPLKKRLLVWGQINLQAWVPSWVWKWVQSCWCSDCFFHLLVCFTKFIGFASSMILGWIKCPKRCETLGIMYIKTQGGQGVVKNKINGKYNIRQSNVNLSPLALPRSRVPLVHDGVYCIHCGRWGAYCLLILN